ncbi:N-acetyltransferase [Paenibacillus albiflavus]|uniref:N-acetyltransferase n=1 Tax=Paenibacillus albiflavus TaxID=2545760 RepID=A0A4R4ER10_9BACL|nr:GNAT family N-acetyltransferase [Paenibacillus albiflavus]TCZ80965.1 N-acetyltransferase [Paenibacillus albiflavus]
MIETSRCKLLHVAENDYEDVIQLFVNEQVRQYLGGTIENEIVLKKKFEDILNRSKNGSHFWVIRTIDNHDFIGLVSLDTYHDNTNTEVSYEILPQWWGLGYATEVIGALTDYAFDELRLDMLFAETQTANTRSCKLLERIGMTLIDRLHRFGAEQSVYCLKREDRNNTCI